MRQGSETDLTLKGDNVIDGSEAIKNATGEGNGSLSKVNANVEGIRVGGEGASDSSEADTSARLTIQGGASESIEETSSDAAAEEETSDDTTGGSLTIKDTTTGIVIAKDVSEVTIGDGANVTIKDTHASGSTQSGNGVIQHGDLTIKDNSSLTIDHMDNGGSNSKGNGIASWNDLIVTTKSKLNIKDTFVGIYGHQDSDAKLTVDDSTLNITDSNDGISYEGGTTDGKHTSAGDISFKDSNVNIEAGRLGITTGNYGNSSITLDNTTASISASQEKEGSHAIYGPEYGGSGNLTVKNGSELSAAGNYGIYAGFKKMTVEGGSTVTTNTVNKGLILRGNGLNSASRTGTKLHITSDSLVELLGGTRNNYFLDATGRNNSILVDNGGKLFVLADGMYTGIGLGTNGVLTVQDGTLLVKGRYKKSGIYAYGNDVNILVKDKAHVESTSITRNSDTRGQKLVITGGTLTYDYSLTNTLWPENAQGNKLTNFLLTKDDAHAGFNAFSYNGTTYEYVSDLDKETDKEHLSVWVPATALEYMLDVDGSHDPDIIGKTLADLQAAGYNFNTKYKTSDGVIVLQDMVVNGHSLNFTKTTDANGSTKLIWGNYENRTDGKPSAYDMVYGTEYEYEGQKYTIVWGYEHKNNADGSNGQNVLDAFTADSNVQVTGANITGEDSNDYTVTIYGALREVVEPTPDPTPNPDPKPEPKPGPDTSVTPEDPQLPPVQDARADTPDSPVLPANPANPANPAVQDAHALPQTGTSLFAALAMALGGFALTIAGAWASLLGKNSRH